MTTDVLQQSLQALAGIDEEQFKRSTHFWQPKAYVKGEYFNRHKQVCKYLGFIVKGVFRTYYVNATSGEETNVFFFSPHQVVVSFQSFIAQAPCNYHTQSMTDSEIICIHIDHLQQLYRESHAWERLGRVLAEMAFSVSLKRTESFLFLSPEERYQDLVQQHPDIFNSIPLYQISSYLGIQGPSLSRIRKRLAQH